MDSFISFTYTFKEFYCINSIIFLVTRRPIIIVKVLRPQGVRMSFSGVFRKKEATLLSVLFKNRARWFQGQLVLVMGLMCVPTCTVTSSKWCLVWSQKFILCISEWLLIAYGAGILGLKFLILYDSVQLQCNKWTMWKASVISGKFFIAVNLLNGKMCVKYLPCLLFM